MNQKIAGATAHLFAPRPAWRFRPVTSNMQFFPEPSFGQDPAYGACINYWLKEKNDSVKIHIVDSTGDTVRTLKHKGKSGINRVMWDLKGEKNEAFVMRTKPLYADWLPLTTKRKVHPFAAPFSILLAPGNYQVHLEATGQSLVQSLEIKKDPHSEGSVADIQAQIALMKDLEQDRNSVVKMVNEIELLRRQFLDLKTTLKALKKPKALIEATEKIDTSLLNIEEQLIQLRYTGTGQDEVRYPVKLAERISYLASTVATADFAPADPHREVAKVLKGRLSKVQQEYTGFKETELKTFTKMLNDKDIGLIVR